MDLRRDRWAGGAFYLRQIVALVRRGFLEDRSDPDLTCQRTAHIRTGGRWIPGRRSALDRKTKVVAVHVAGQDLRSLLIARVPALVVAGVMSPWDRRSFTWSDAV